MLMEQQKEDYAYTAAADPFEIHGFIKKILLT